jgi:bifunctional polynucleotide phosphatase/kinase
MSTSIHYIKPDKPSFWWNTLGPHKIAAFDFDSTLVDQISGAKFPRDANDWEPFFDAKIMKEKFQQLDKNGYIIIIITNQGGVDKHKITIDTMEQRIKNFTTFIGDTPIYTFAAIKYDRFRKPCTGIWDYITTHTSKGGWCAEEIDVKNSFYVGDAAGRTHDCETGKDFSCSDRKFAYNCGLVFLTPEEFFLGAVPTNKWEWGGIDPVQELSVRSTLKPVILELNNKPEMIILVGCAASGKSSLCNQFPGYTIINMDTLKTKAKCIKLAKETVNCGKSLIIDNTNPDPAIRKLYTDIAKENSKCPHYVRCINVNCSKDLAHHLNQLRVQMSSNTTPGNPYVDSVLVPKIAYNIYYKKYVKPSTTEEDIDEVIEYEWIPKFQNDLHKKYFLMKY